MSHQPTNPTTDLTAGSLDTAIESLPAGVPVLMVNLLRYRETAEYGDVTSGSISESTAPTSGREAYFQGYLPAFAKVTAEVGVAGVQVFFAGRVQAALVAPDAEHWDDVAIVQYPDLDAFRRIVRSPQYTEQADPHRAAALADWRLLATTALDIAG